MSGVIERQYAIVAQKYINLRFERQDDGSGLVKGDLRFSASFNGESIEDSYEIELVIPADYPRKLPTVHEIGGRISKDFHRNPDASLCLGAPLQIRMKFQKNPTLLGFIEEQVIPYLYSHSYFEKYGKMPFGELSHGVKGIIEFYQELFILQSEVAVLGFLRILVDKNYRGHHNCPCGSGIKLRFCHGPMLMDIMKQQNAEEFALEYLLVGDYLNKKGINIPNSYISKSLRKKLRKS